MRSKQLRSLSAIGAALLVLSVAPLATVAGQATVAGHVFDSTSRTMLAGAVVQLLRADDPSAPVAYSGRADSSGRFAIAGVTPGRYLAGFVHPLLDSLDVDLPARPLDVRPGSSTVRLSLAVPSAAAMAAVLCPAGARSDSTGAVFGRLYDAETLRPVPNAAVTVSWTELTIGAAGVRQRRPALRAATGEGGRFVICGVPASGVVGVHAARGDDTTGNVELDLPGGGGARRDLFVGSVSTMAAADTVRLADGSSAVISRVTRRGSARMTGTVRDKDGRAIRGARLRVAESGVEAVTDSTGRFTLTNAPGGTQSVEVRAIGFFPESRIVDLVASRPASLHVTLATMRSVLDTVRVTASRIYSTDRSGFERRRRSAGHGHFFDQNDVARLRPLNVAQLLNRVPGVSIGGDAYSGTVLMRDMQGGFCQPLVYIDGVPISELTAREIDAWVPPNEIAGMEVYPRAGQAPMEFTRLDGCGALVLWTRPVPSRRQR